jgi:uncharacterized protein HemX
VFDSLSSTLATVIVAGVGALGAYLGGVRYAKAQLITAASTAADLMLKQQDTVIRRQDAVIERLEGKVGRLEAQDSRCQHDLAEVREQLAALRVAARLPPWQPTPPTEGPDHD